MQITSERGQPLYDSKITSKLTGPNVSVPLYIRTLNGFDTLTLPLQVSISTLAIIT